MNTTKLSVVIASGLDGYIATGGGSLAWLEEAACREEDNGYEPFLASVDAPAVGCGTYDAIAGNDLLPLGTRPVLVFTDHPPRPREASPPGRSHHEPPGALERPWVWPGSTWTAAP